MPYFWGIHPVRTVEEAKPELSPEIGVELVKGRRRGGGIPGGQQPCTGLGAVRLLQKPSMRS